MPTLIELFRNTKCMRRVGMMSSMPTQFLESNCAFGCKYHIRNQRTRLPYTAVENMLMSLRLFWRATYSMNICLL